MTSLTQLLLKFRQKSVSLRLILTVPFVLQLVGTVTLVGGLSWRQGQQAVNDVASQFRQEITHRIEQNLQTYLSTPHHVNQLNQDALDLGILDLQNLEDGYRFLEKQIQNFNSLSVIAIANEQGEQITLLRTQNHQLTVAVCNAETDFNLDSYQLDSQGNLGTLVKSSPNYDPRRRPWYQAAVAAEYATWSDVYLNFIDGFPQISAVLPIYDSNQKLLGVTTSVLRLATVSEFLNSLKIGQTGQAFIVEKNGLLIGTSTQEQIFFKSQNKYQRLNYINSQNSLTYTTANSLKKQVGELYRINQAQSFEFIDRGKRYFTQVTPFQDQKSLDWLIVVVIPEADFMAKINQNTRNTILLCLATLILAITLGILTSKQVTKPIFQLSEVANRLAESARQSFIHQSLPQKVEFQKILELETLANAFNQMSTQLTTSFSNLEATNLELENSIHQLKEMQIQVIQAEKMSSLGELMAGVAHEINNPLGCLSNNVQYIALQTQDLLSLINLYQTHFPNPGEEIEAEIDKIDLDFVSEDLPRLIQSMDEGANRIVNISTALRNFVRTDSVDKSSFDLKEGLESTLLILKHRLKGNSARAEIQIIRNYSDLPSVKAYPSQINQVFMNLLANAIDAIDEASEKQCCKACEAFKGKIIITICLSSDQQQVMIKIKDNGLGIPEEIQSKIFEHLFTTKPVGKGTGLGLSISHQIITEKHGGSLSCYSKVGEGTEFTVMLPRCCPTQPSSTVSQTIH